MVVLEPEVFEAEAGVQGLIARHRGFEEETSTALVSLGSTP
jgi:hypothetical protein